MGNLMGIMDPMSVTQSPRSEDHGLSRVFDWHLHFCWLPSKCFLSDKNIWLKKCYKGTRIITGPGEPVTIDYHIDKYEFLLWQLKK